MWVPNEGALNNGNKEGENSPAFERTRVAAGWALFALLCFVDFDFT